MIPASTAIPPPFSPFVGTGNPSTPALIWVSRDNYDRVITTKERAFVVLRVNHAQLRCKRFQRFVKLRRPFIPFRSLVRKIEISRLTNTRVLDEIIERLIRSLKTNFVPEKLSQLAAILGAVEGAIID